ncbi:signal transduction protein [Mongoliitalea daihaiensis]|nr:signal transduction protein [Mongoliitalea daihaiensis]
MYAQEQQLPTIIQIEDGLSQIKINTMMDFLLDTAAILSIEDIQKPENQQRFQKVTDSHILYDYYDSYIWIKLTVQNKQQSFDKSWYFESWGFDIKNISFYFPNPDGSFEIYEAGFELPFRDRSIQHKNFNYFLDLRPGEQKTFYLRVQRTYNLEFSFHLRTNDRFLSHSLNEYFLLGIYYGVLILILIFNLYLFFKLKDLLYLYFPGLILSYIWFSLGRDGLGFQYFWPNAPWLNQFNNQYVIEFFIIVATLLFSNRFVQKYTKSDRVVKFTNGAILLKLVFFVNQLFFFELHYTSYLVITILILLIPFIFGLRELLKEEIHSWSYIFAYACLFLIITYTYSRSIELFDNPVLNWYLVYPVIFIEMILFSFSIFNQIKFLQSEFVRANTEKTLVLEKNNQLTLELNSKLKEKVKARTEKIERMAADLAQKNDELVATNQKLEELNKKVTEMNMLLQENNEELKSSVEETTKSLALMKGLGFEEFKKVFPDKDTCLQFLAELKWKNGFHCKKCEYNKFQETSNFSKRCKNCNYLESPTVDTLFHKLKFPIEKAFYILYLSNRKDVDLTLNELSEILELRRETCWAFKNKIAQAMEKIDHNKDLSGWESLALVHLE